ncbi:MAG: hypothetical protein ACKOUD_03485 [Rhodoluna sp.]
MAKKNLGIGRLLIAAYAVLALAASGRAGYELVAKFEQAPLPYALSAASALIYILATIALARSTPAWRKVAYAAVTIELTGVLLIGTASLIWPEVFTFGGKQIKTVWSYFGIAYGFVPLALPILGLLWLRKAKRD